MDIGDKFHYLTVTKLSETPSGKVGVVCDCGVAKFVDSWSLRTGKVKSCGCYGRLARIKANTKHGHHRRGKTTSEYSTWANMLARCFDSKHKDFHLYGGRGITVCDAWKDFSTFLAAVGSKPNGHTLDRVNVDVGYEPGNVRWATNKEQARNKRNNRVLEHNGKSMCVADWVDETGLSSSLIINRIEYLGWSVEKTLSTPARKCKPRNKFAAEVAQESQ